MVDALPRLAPVLQIVLLDKDFEATWGEPDLQESLRLLWRIGEAKVEVGASLSNSSNNSTTSVVLVMLVVLIV